MRAGDRDRLMDRIRKTRETVKTTKEPRSGGARDRETTRPAAMEERIAHLEQLLEGLQDSVHRESIRQDKRIAELEAQIQPGALEEALSKDARERGL